MSELFGVENAESHILDYFNEGNYINEIKESPQLKSELTPNNENNEIRNETLVQKDVLFDSKVLSNIFKSKGKTRSANSVKRDFNKCLHNLEEHSKKPKFELSKPIFEKRLRNGSLRLCCHKNKEQKVNFVLSVLQHSKNNFKMNDLPNCNNQILSKTCSENVNFCVTTRCSLWQTQDYYCCDDFIPLKNIVRRLYGKREGYLQPFIVVENTTKQGCPKLFDAKGYFYTIRNNGSSSEHRTIWGCCLRGSNFSCRGRVLQQNSFFEEQEPHCHRPQKEKFVRSIISAEVLHMIRDTKHIHRTAMSIIKSVIESFKMDFPFEFNLDNMVRSINFQKGKIVALNCLHNERYTLNKKKIPKDFFIEKILTERKFHVTLATASQLKYLVSSNYWFIDECVVNVAPMTHALTILVQTAGNDGVPTWTPVFYGLLSDKRQEDYVRALNSIISSLPQPPVVETILIDLNVPLRHALSNIFPTAEVLCCDRHWTLNIATRVDKATGNDHAILRQLSLLNFVPGSEFEPSLRRIELALNDDYARDAIHYIRKTFGNQSLWPSKFWCFYKALVRTNEHELWRDGVFCEGQSCLNIYDLVESLYVLSKSINQNLNILSKRDVKIYYMTCPESLYYRIHKQCKLYSKGGQSCEILLKNLTDIYYS